MPELIVVRTAVHIPSFCSPRHFGWKALMFIYIELILLHTHGMNLCPIFKLETL